MNDATEEDITRSSDLAAMRSLAMKFAAKSSRTRPLKAERREKEKQVRSVVDGRSLRATGRTEQLNVNIRPDLKLAIAEQVKSEGIKIVDWVERVFDEALGLKGN